MKSLMIRYADKSYKYRFVVMTVVLSVILCIYIIRVLSLKQEVDTYRSMAHDNAQPAIIGSVLKQYNSSISSSYAEYLGNIIHTNAKAQEIDADLILRVILVESNGNVKAKSDKGAIGLMQVMPTTAKALGFKEDLFNPEMNVKIGTFYLARLIDKYGLETALGMYLCGESNRRCRFSYRTKLYVDAVMSVKRVI